MSYTTIYEATGDISPFSFEFVFVCIFFTAVTVLAVIGLKNPNTRGKFALVLIPLMFLIFLIAQFTTFFQTKQVFDNYSKGECEVVEGTLSGYEQYCKDEIGSADKEDCPDRFFVGNVKFVMLGYQTYGFEYSLRRADGSELKDGQHVKIYYTYFKHQNLIFRIDIAQKEE